MGKGQTTTESMLLLAAVVGGVLIVGTLLKRYMPTVFSSVGGMITGVVGSMGDTGVASTSVPPFQSKTETASSVSMSGESTTEKKEEKTKEERTAPTWEGGDSPGNAAGEGYKHNGLHQHAYDGNGRPICCNPLP